MNSHDSETRRVSDVVAALASSVERNELAQEKFRYAVVRKLARLEARARVLQLSDIVDPRTFASVSRAVEQEAGIESMVSELSEELERKMYKEISVGNSERGEAYSRRGRARRGEKQRNWADCPEYEI